MSTKTTEAAADKNTVKDAVNKAQEWNNEAIDKLRDFAAKANQDAKTSGNIAIEGHAQYNTRLFQMIGDLLNKRTEATMALLEASDVSKAIEIEQDCARTVTETLQSGLRELGEISVAAAKDVSATYTERAKEVVDGLTAKKDG